jgi:hypothetical protein
LEANPGTTGDFQLTITAHNYIPLETTIPVVNGPYVNYTGWILNDSLGNGDGIANPNEIILLSPLLKNTGNATANNISLILRSQDPCITISDSTEYLSTLNQADSTCLDNAFTVLIGNTTNAHTLCFELEITEATRVLTFYPGILIGTPLLGINKFWVSNAPTMPGDTSLLYLDIANTGYGCAHMTQILLATTDPYAAIITDSIAAGDIPPETTRTVGPFNIAIANSCPAGHHPQLSLTMSAESYIFDEDIVLVVGETGFADNMESGSGLWTTGGSSNQWHISTRRAFSPAHSWYCGDEVNGIYTNNMNCYIQTIPFMTDHNSVLRFMRWFQVPIYGSDGIYVIIMHGSGADTLNFIGTGGALGGGRDLQSDWFEETYSLAQYAGGDTIQIRISFVSDYDGDVAEGFYIDDVNINAITYIEEYENENIYALNLDVNPNPFRSITKIRYSILDSGYLMQNTALRIYDAAGRLVKSLDPGSSIPVQNLESEVSWDGRDDCGRTVAPGVYFVVLSKDKDALSAKIVRIR